ncbi:MAG: glycosyltransferase family 39 protein [Anaerolineae bacterium]|nr:glycosyltransferase family 39 protein [Anaerolineae bacterium]
MRAPTETKESPQPARSLTAPLILLLAALLRFYNLSGQSLWADEGNSAALARRGFVEIARRTAFDIHPPFYYWLLKCWTFFFGSSEAGLRSLSVVLGVGLVYIIGVLGTRWFGPRVGLMAAFMAAFSPLQIYYSQEARMYMLLALLSSLTVLVAALIWQSDRRPRTTDRRFSWLTSPAGLIYVLVVTAGLYTHYAYPIILLAVNLAALIWFWQLYRGNGGLEGWKAASSSHPPFTIRHSPFATQNWLSLQLIPILLYLPWLPVAWRQITTWPSERQTSSFLAMVETISTTLLFGLSWPFDFSLFTVFGLALMLVVTMFYVSRFRAKPPRGKFQSQRHPVGISRLTLLWLWLLLPVGLTLVIFSPAFLKFLIVAAPALALLLAVAIESLTFYVSRLTSAWLKYLPGAVLLSTFVGPSILSLYYYYYDPAYARDNYRGIANFIKAVGGPDDAVILDAEGQQDIFNYYYTDSAAPKAPVYPLPRQRPLDEATTLAELQEITARANTVYAVYWATQQADPNGLIEGWLDKHLFKATDQWYGNVRLVSYASPFTSAKLPLTPVNYQFGAHIQLAGYALSASRITPGDILQLALSWKTDVPLQLDENYTVFVQVLDQADHLVGQRDAPPLNPMSEWPAHQPVADAHGIFIEPGTPPGPHRLILGLYNSQTGQRLPLTGGQDFVELAQVEIIRPVIPFPPDAFKMQVTLNQPMLDVTLLGYDFYKLGHRSTPETPLHPGDPVQLVGYWQAREPVRRLQDQLFIQVVTNSGEATPIFVTRQPAGTDYPLPEWQEDEIIRAQYNFFLENLPPGTYRLALTLSGQESSSGQVTALTKPFRVEE